MKIIYNINYHNKTWIMACIMYPVNMQISNKHHILICIRLLKHVKIYLAVASITDGSVEVIMCLNATL